jgi:hypothetical protein
MPIGFKLMRKIQKLIFAEKTEFSPYSNLSTAPISRIARKRRRDEVADAHVLMKQYKAELAPFLIWTGIPRMTSEVPNICSGTFWIKFVANPATEPVFFNASPARANDLSDHSLSRQNQRLSCS